LAGFQRMRSRLHKRRHGTRSRLQHKARTLRVVFIEVSAPLAVDGMDFFAAMERICRIQPRLRISRPVRSVY
jgi:hypothetical protein